MIKPDSFQFKSLMVKLVFAKSFIYLLCLNLVLWFLFNKMNPQEEMMTKIKRLKSFNYFEEFAQQGIAF